MSGKILKLRLEKRDGPQDVAFVARHCVIAGWTGRDVEGVEAHIRELELIGVPRPKEIPVFYRVSTSQLTTRDKIQVAGKNTSGEAEIVLFVDNGNTYVGIGSDHTDRKLETVNITQSKQVCDKPVSRSVWLLQDIIDHWDQLMLVSRIKDQDTTPYQSGLAAAIKHPHDILTLYRARIGELPQGMVMFCGTLPVNGPLRYENSFTIRLEDPVLGRHLQHSYHIESLPIAED
jgi:hypothetical protein